MTARALADPPRDPIDGWPTSPETPHPAGPNGPRAELDRLTGVLAAAVPPLAAWVQELADSPQPPPSDRLVESRAVARRVAAMGRRGGDPR